MSKSKIPFEMSGVFASVVEWRKGLPRRVEIEQGSGRLVLKVAKDLRPRFAEITTGSELKLLGFAEFSGDRVKRKITGLGGALSNVRPPERMVIQVCAKKHCWTKGGSEVFEKLEKRIADKGLTDVRLEKTGCLGNCKNCPSARVPGADLLLGKLDRGNLERLLPADLKA